MENGLLFNQEPIFRHFTIKVKIVTITITALMVFIPITALGRLSFEMGGGIWKTKDFEELITFSRQRNLFITTEEPFMLVVLTIQMPNQTQHIFIREMTDYKLLFTFCNLGMY